MWKLLITAFTVLVLSSQVLGQTSNDTLQTRDSKLFSMFQVIKFPNDPCVATNSRNGTCYTTSECTTKGGTSAGTCASGFGICCTFILGCGGSAAQNCTYVENSGASSGVCKYSICKSNSNVCQLRLDFVSFVITGPSTRSISIAATITNPAAVGVSDATQCTTDTFTVSSASNTVPVLCGTLTNDHLYVDALASCNDLTFVMAASAASGTTTIPTRSWQIKVTQYNCDYSNRAPPGCLQYFFNTAGTGTVRSFNYGATTPYHLANQKQSICIRREAGYCRICWYTAAISDFSVSGGYNVITAMNAGYIKGSSCCAYGAAGIGVLGYDCVMIPGASNAAGTAVKAPSYCGRRLTTVTAAITSKTVCSKQTPFQISFFSDGWENAAASATGTEAAQTKSGFQLVYAQTSTNC